MYDVTVCGQNIIYLMISKRHNIRQLSFFPENNYVPRNYGSRLHFSLISEPYPLRTFESTMQCDKQNIQMQLYPTLKTSDKKPGDFSTQILYSPVEVVSNRHFIGWARCIRQHIFCKTFGSCLSSTALFSLEGVYRLTIQSVSPIMLAQLVSQWATKGFQSIFNMGYKLSAITSQTYKIWRMLILSSNPCKHITVHMDHV